MDEEIKVAILGQKLEDLKHIVIKIDAAIEKLSEVNTNVIKMLAVHDEKIDNQQKVDDLIIKMIEDIKSENDKEHKRTLERVEVIENKAEDFSKVKWMTIGIGVFGALTATAVSTLASGWLTPSEMGFKMEHRYVPIPENTQNGSRR